MLWSDRVCLHSVPLNNVQLVLMVQKCVKKISHKPLDLHHFMKLIQGGVGSCFCVLYANFFYHSDVMEEINTPQNRWCILSPLSLNLGKLMGIVTGFFFLFSTERVSSQCGRLSWLLHILIIESGYLSYRFLSIIIFYQVILIMSTWVNATSCWLDWKTASASSWKGIINEVSDVES